jgi:2-oxoisovalerate ferredoxin oxidoreductase beta subunit
LGFSLIEVLSPCPTIWKLTPVEAQHWVRDVMEKEFRLGVFCDRTKERTEKADLRPTDPGSSSHLSVGAPDLRPVTPDPALEELPRILGVAEEDLPEGNAAALADDKAIDLEVRIAGFGGQGVLLFGEVLAEAGLDAGLEVSWLPSYGPEMRSGTSNCHVRLSRQSIDSPLVTAPNVLVAMNEPSLRKFDKSVRAGGWVIYNGQEFPADCVRDGVHVVALPFTELADELGDKRAANMVMLGALLEIAGVLPQASIDDALRRLVKNPRWVELDERALARGRELYRESLVEV